MGLPARRRGGSQQTEQLGGTAAGSDSNELETMESPMIPSMSNALRMNMTACLAIAMTIAVTAMGPQGVLGQTAAPSGTSVADLTSVPPVAWLPDPVPAPDAEAKVEAEMKPYAEKIPGTDVSFAMVPIRGGRFVMGSPASEADRGEDEGPAFEAEVEPFWMGKHEVTWDEYELWSMGVMKQLRGLRGVPATKWDELADAITMPTRPYADMTFGMGRDGFPAICMTQLAAKVYCKWLSAKTGRYYRLPTEAEWEYACRAGTTTAYSFGDDPEQLDQYASYFDNSDDRYHKVGEKKPNAWGLYDMHGNVAEWVLDQYTSTGYPVPKTLPAKNPLTVPATIYPRVVRGGSWMDDPEQLRSAARLSSTEEWKAQDPQLPQSVWYYTDATFIGLRVVRPLRQPTPKEAAAYDIDEVQRVDMIDYMELKGAGE
jgi:formylglycine-generating enzyme required for sulfatase activity